MTHPPSDTGNLGRCGSKPKKPGSKRCPKLRAVSHVLPGAMRAPFDPRPAASASPVRLAELLVSAAATLSSTAPSGAAGLAPAGMPVRQGRLHLGRVRHWLPADGGLVVLAGFG